MRTDIEKKLDALSDRIDKMMLRNKIHLLSLAIADLFYHENAAIIDTFRTSVMIQAQKLARKYDKFGYFDTEDSADVIRYKKCVLKEHVSSASEQEKESFAALYPGLLPGVEAFLVERYPEDSSVLGISALDKEHISFWWLC